MADGKHTASVRPCAPQNQSESVTPNSAQSGARYVPADISFGVAEVPTEDLAQAAFKVGERPELAAEMAREMGVGAVPKPSGISLLSQVLRGFAVPPPEGNEWWPKPAEGAFDGGVARVTGYLETEDGVNQALLPGAQKDMLGDLMRQVQESYAFARYAALLASALVECTDPNDAENSIEVELSRIGSVAFLAGWYMAFEAADSRRAQRDAQREQQVHRAADRGGEGSPAVPNA